MAVKSTFNNLTAEDAAVILELAPILDIAVARRVEDGSERKFYLETTYGERRMMRVGSVNDWGYKYLKDGDHVFAYIAKTGLPVTRMLSYGHCGGGTLYYQLHTWLDGEAPHKIIPYLSPSEQFALGVKCGEAARKLHTLPPLGASEPWEVRIKREVQKKIKSYSDKPIKTRAEDLLIGYLQDNIGLTDGRPQTFTHGDWDTSNIILMPDGQIGIIDCGIPNSDPWREFCAVGDSPHFCTGQVKGYFGGEPPAEYFPLLAFYTAEFILHWGYDSENVLSWYDNMRNPVPSWYLKEYTPL